MDALRLLCVTAHPDDESLGFGGALARAAAEGVEVTLAVATRGEHGWAGPPAAQPEPNALGALREAELREAATILGIRRIAFLGYVDGEVDRADPTEAIGRVVACIRDLRPQVVLTFGPDGAYGHPDHIAVSQFTTAAIGCAADPVWRGPAVGEGIDAPHRVAKLYHRVWTIADNRRFRDAFGPIRMVVDGVVRGDVEWPEWLPTARLDTSAHWRTVRDAAARHRSQFPEPAFLDRFPDDVQRGLWGSEAYVRAFSSVNACRTEDDLFAGLRRDQT